MKLSQPIFHWCTRPPTADNVVVFPFPEGEAASVRDGRCIHLPGVELADARLVQNENFLLVAFCSLLGMEERRRRGEEVVERKHLRRAQVVGRVVVGN